MPTVLDGNDSVIDSVLYGCQEAPETSPNDRIRPVSYTRLDPDDWVPLSRIVRGIALANYPDSSDTHRVLELGSSVYVFEVHRSRNWYRGYVVSATAKGHSDSEYAISSQPFSSFHSHMFSGLQIATAVFPAKAVRIRELYLMTSSPPTPLSESALTRPFQGVHEKPSGDLRRRTPPPPPPPPPPLPYLKVEYDLPSEPLIEDIASLITEWFSDCVLRYLLDGETDKVGTVLSAIKDLHSIRQRLVLDLYTTTERVLARRTALRHISRIHKLLARNLIVRDPSSGITPVAGYDHFHLANDQLRLALDPYYPEIEKELIRVSSLSFQKSIAVDFTSFRGILGEGRFVIVVYVRTSEIAFVSECLEWSVYKESPITSCPKVVFDRIPLSLAKNGVYLVAEVYELTPAERRYDLYSSHPSVILRKQGIATGVASISHLFRFEGQVKVPFTLRLYASYFENGNPSEFNRGWGELSSRIIRGSPIGVAITKKAVELKGYTTAFVAGSPDHHLDDIPQDEEGRVERARSLYGAGIALGRNDIFLHFGVLVVKPWRNTNRELKYTLLVTSSDHSAQFLDSSNGLTSTHWLSVEVVNGESIGQMVHILGVKIETMLSFQLFSDAELLATKSLTLFDENDGIISGPYEVNFRKVDFVAVVRTTVEYVGDVHFDKSIIQNLINWKHYCHSGLFEVVLASVGQLRRSAIVLASKNFYVVLENLVFLLSSTDNADLEHETFLTILSVLSKVLLNDEDEYNSVTDHFCGRVEISSISSRLISLIRGHLTDSSGSDEMEFPFKVLPFLSRLIAKATARDKPLDEGAEVLTSDQLSREISDLAKDFVKVVKDASSPRVDFVSMIYDFFACLNGLISPQVTIACLCNILDEIRDSDQELHIQKLLVIKRISSSWMFLEKGFRDYLTGHTIKWINDFINDRYMTNNELAQVYDELRLVSDILHTQIRMLWEDGDTQFKLLRRYSAAFLLVISRLYTDVLEASEVGRQDNDFDSMNGSRALLFTPIFPGVYPFEWKPVGSYVQSGSFSEMAIEQEIVFSWLIRAAARCCLQNTGSDGGAVLELSLDDTVPRQNEGILKYTSIIIRAVKGMLERPPYPKTWASLRARSHDTALRCVELVRESLTRSLPNDGVMEASLRQLWIDYTTCVLQIAGSELLDLESSSEEQRPAIARICPDVRDKAIRLFMDKWKKLGRPATRQEKERYGIENFGGHQDELVDTEGLDLTKQIARMCFLGYSESMIAGVETIYSIIISAVVSNGNLKQVENRLILAIEDLCASEHQVPSPQAKKAFHEYFDTVIKRIDQRDVIFQRVVDLETRIFKFLDMHLELHAAHPRNPYSDDRISLALKIFSFLKYVDEGQRLTRYIFDIYSLHRARKHFTEAGLALKLLAHLFKWSLTVQVPECPIFGFPSQSSFERKEVIYEKMIECFSHDGSLEDAIGAIQELMLAYQSVSLDFNKLVETSNLLGRMYSDLANQRRPPPQFFRVSYAGAGFSRYYDGRQFIFQGPPGESVDVIHDKLLTIYPLATVVTSEGDITSEGQYLHITAVDPEPELSDGDEHVVDLLLRTPSAAPRAGSHVIRRGLHRFCGYKPIEGGTTALNTFVEKTTYVTQKKFPSIDRRCEITQEMREIINPVDNMRRLLKNKTGELLELYRLIACRDGRYVTPSDERMLELHLDGAVDSPINGGIMTVRQFLEPQNAVRFNLDSVIKLRKAILEYTHILQISLEAHGTIVSEQMRPHHEAMVASFNINYAKELVLLHEGPDDNL